MISNIKGSHIVAATFVAALCLWFWVGPQEDVATTDNVAPESAAANGETAPLIVETVHVLAESMVEVVELQGSTAPSRQVTVRAETAGRVEAILVQRGARVLQGQAVMRLSEEDRPAKVRMSAALLTQREREYAAIRELADAGNLAATRADEAFALLEAARAELVRVKEDLAKTKLAAPFAGILNERDIEIGDYVGIRDPVFTVVDDNPLIVAVDVAQQNKSAIEIGGESSVNLITGEQLPATVKYVSAVANPQTRTFRVELEIANPDGAIPTGVSAKAAIPTKETLAHRLSPGWLIRTEDDRFGVFLVDENMHAQFVPIDIIRADRSNVWVSGLPDAAQVVSSGHGFLRDGQVIRLASEQNDVGRSPVIADALLAQQPADVGQP